MAKGRSGIGSQGGRRDAIGRFSREETGRPQRLHPHGKVIAAAGAGWAHRPLTESPSWLKVASGDQPAMGALTE